MATSAVRRASSAEMANGAASRIPGKAAWPLASVIHDRTCTRQAMRFLNAAVLAVAAATIPASAAVRAQGITGKDESPLAIGETFTIDSRVLGEARRINVYV